MAVEVARSKAKVRTGAQACHVSAKVPAGHSAPDHSAQKNRINRIIGQLRGIERMIDAHRYCPEILLQTRAAQSAIRALESTILEEHLRHCVRDAFQARDPSVQEQKIAELLEMYTHTK